MAMRPVYVSGLKNYLCKREMTEFDYVKGLSVIQKTRCAQSLRRAFLREYPNRSVLEISNYSDNDLGVKLSAFNLPLKLKDGKEVSVECAFQAGKVFEKGGPYVDLLDGTSRAAKKDERLKNSGKLIGFEFEGERFELVPKTSFYNWLYINALHSQTELSDALMEYDAFTDIVFNPEKSTNCQAEAAAYYVALRKLGLLEEALKSREDFVRILYKEGNTGKYNTKIFNTKKVNNLQVEEEEKEEEKKEEVPFETSFQVGDKVKHGKFGEGTILNIIPKEGSATLEIQFSVGVKNLDEKLGKKFLKKC